MKYQLLALLILTAFSINQVEDVEIKLEEIAEGIKLSCSDKSNVVGNGLDGPDLSLVYRDDNTGEYRCGADSKILVKFRTCDNCVELDTFSIVGLAVGDVVATIVVGVAVYLIASQARTGQVKPTKKRSDKQNLIPNERSNDTHYQQLRHKPGGRDEYDVLNKK